jgi:fructose-bisphosphate aldolase class II
LEEVVMGYTTIAELLIRAGKKHYAVGSFNAWDIQSVRTVINTAREESSPVIISVWKEEIDLCGAENLFDVCRNEIERSSIPAALFLDHAHSLEECIEAIRLGANSVMIDGSDRPLEENIRITKSVVQRAGKNGIAVEGELGVLGAETGDDAAAKHFTDPEDASRFTAESGVDCLAVAIGNAHGFYKQKPRLDFKRLKEIEKATNVPLVLHGGSGIPDSDIRKAIAIGIAKINVGAEGRKAFFYGMKEIFRTKPEEIFPSVIYEGARREHRAILIEKMRLFGSSNMA